MKKHLFLLITFISLSTYSQIKLKTYSNKIKNGFEFLADNDEYCPVSVKVDFSLNNMTSSNGNYKIFVIPARTKNFLITKLEVKKKGRFGYGVKTRYNYGNHHLKKHDEDYVYNLPFNTGDSYRISQGYQNNKTHKNENSLDFSMPIGTEIYAARAGVVVKVIDTNTVTCYRKDCSKYNNLIKVYHNDGTFAVYVHIDTNGAMIKAGDKVTKNQLLAKSGNIGWSSGPHLHFSVFHQKIEGRETYKTKFKINDGSEIKYLEEKETYTRNY